MSRLDWSAVSPPWRAGWVDVAYALMAVAAVWAVRL